MSYRTKTLKARIADVLGETPEVLTAYLFGSFSRGDAGSASDVDLGILLASEQGESRLVGPFSRLAGSLERATGLSVDLVNLRKAPPDLVHRILRDGELLLDRDPGERVTFEVRARSHYFDLLPHLERYRRHQAA